MEENEELKSRIDSGYGMVITGFNLNHDIIHGSSHWSETFFKKPPIILKKNDTLEILERQIVNIQKLKDSKRSFLLHSEFSSTEIWSAEEKGYPTFDKIAKICFFDRLKSVCEGDCYTFRYSRKTDKKKEILLTLKDYGKKPLTPIEKLLKDGLLREKFQFEPQVTIGKYIVDFLISYKDTQLIVEADGAQYHIPEKDEERDKAIYEEYGIETLRFGGSEIIVNLEDCISRVKEKLQSIETFRKQYGFEDLERLDDSQKNAIEHGYGSARIVAPAGSGKTKVLVNRVVKLINRGVRPEGILCLAFNSDAVSQLEDRLGSLGINVKRPQQERDNPAVTVATFNSLGLSILRKIAVIQNKPLSEVEEKKIARKVFQQIFANSEIKFVSLRNHDPWEDFFKKTSKIKAGLADPHKEDLEVKQSNDDTKTIPIEPLFSSFEKECEKLNRVSFDGQIYSAVGALLSNYVERNRLQDSFSHLVVDEYQDLNQVQVSLLRIIVAKRKEIFAVGDDDQLIYSWRHVESSNILDFENLFPSMENYPLSVNYRSSKKVIEVTKRLIKYNNPHRLNKDIIPYERNPEGLAKLFCSDMLFKQLDWIIKRLRETQKKQSASLSSFAILTRYNAAQFLIAYALDKAKIPRSTLRNAESLYKKEAVKVLISYLTIIDNPEKAKADHWQLIMNKPNRYITNNFVSELASEKNILSYFDALIEFEKKQLEWRGIKKRVKKDGEEERLVVKYKGGEITELPSSLGEKWRSNHLKELVDSIKDLSKKLVDCGPVEIISSILEKFPYSENSKAKVSNSEELTDDLILDLIKEDSRQFENLSDFFKHVENQIDLEDAERQALEREREAKREDKTPKVTISSIHRSKGKEWDHVFVFDLHDPEKVRRATSEKKIGSSKIEERRVFYVGMTRSRLNLFVTGRKKDLSSFAEEAFLWPKLIKEKDPIGALDDRMSKLKSELEDLELERSQLEQMGDEFKSEVERKRKQFKNMIEEKDQDLEKAFKIKTGSFFGQTFLGKMSEADKQRNIQNLKDQRLRYESQLSELDSASMRDIGAEKRNNEKNIEETKKKIKSTDEMKYNASQLYQ